MTAIKTSELATSDPDIDVFVDMDEIDRVLDARIAELYRDVEQMLNARVEAVTRMLNVTLVHERMGKGVVELREAIIGSLRVREMAPRAFKLTLSGKDAPKPKPEQPPTPIKPGSRRDRNGRFASVYSERGGFG